MTFEELFEKRDNTIDILIDLMHMDYDVAKTKANEYVSRKFLQNPSQITCIRFGANTPAVSLHTDESGMKWIRVKALDEDFLLSLHNMRDGDKDRFTWDEAMKFAESQGQELPSKKQWMLVDIFRDDIDRLISENGGDPLEVWYWSKTVSQYYSTNAWFYYGNTGTLGGYIKYRSYGGRSLVYL